MIFYHLSHIVLCPGVRRGGRQLRLRLRQRPRRRRRSRSRFWRYVCIPLQGPPVVITVTIMISFVIVTISMFPCLIRVPVLCARPKGREQREGLCTVMTEGSISDAAESVEIFLHSWGTTFPTLLVKCAISSKVANHVANHHDPRHYKRRIKQTRPH